LDKSWNKIELMKDNAYDNLVHGEFTDVADKDKDEDHQAASF